MPVGVALVLMLSVSTTLGVEPRAQKPSPPDRLNACTVLSREEVEKIFPWEARLDQGKDIEMAHGEGSVCVYPSVQFFVGKYSPAKIDAARRIGPLIPVSGIGDEAFLQQNGKNWALLYVKAGERWVSIEKDIPVNGTFESLKPPLTALGKAIVAKLR